MNTTVLNRLKLNGRDVYQGTVKTPPLYRTLLFFLLLGCVVPNYEDFLYYYQIDISGFTQMQYSYLNVVSYIVLFATAVSYGSLFSKTPLGWMIFAAIVINIFGSLTTVMYTTGHTLGINPYAFVCMSSTVMTNIYSTYCSIASGVVFAKLIGDDVETSMFALLTGLINFSNLFASKELALAFNQFVGVYYYSETDNNLYEIWKLYFIQAGCAVFPIFFLWLLPTPTQVKEV